MEYKIVRSKIEPNDKNVIWMQDVYENGKYKDTVLKFYNGGWKTLETKIEHPFDPNDYYTKEDMAQDYYTKEQVNQAIAASQVPEVDPNLPYIIFANENKGYLVSKMTYDNTTSGNYAGKVEGISDQDVCLIYFVNNVQYQAHLPNPCVLWNAGDVPRIEPGSGTEALRDTVVYLGPSQGAVAAIKNLKETDFVSGQEPDETFWEYYYEYNPDEAPDEEPSDDSQTEQGVE